MRKYTVEYLQSLADKIVPNRFKIIKRNKSNVYFYDRIVKSYDHKRVGNFLQSCHRINNRNDSSKRINITDAGRIPNNKFCFPYVIINGKHYLRYPNVYRYIHCASQTISHHLTRTDFLVLNKYDMPKKARCVLLPNHANGHISVANIKSLYCVLSKLLKHPRNGINTQKIKELMNIFIDQYRDEIEDLTPKQVQLELDKHNTKVANVNKPKPSKKVELAEFNKIKSAYGLAAKRNHRLNEQLYKIRKTLIGVKATHTWYKNQLQKTRNKVAELKSMQAWYEKHVQKTYQRQPWYKRVFSALVN